MKSSPPPTGSPEVVLDLSRLLSRILHATPTGVDRCEMAYARGLLAGRLERVHFAAVHPSGFYGRLPRDATLRFLDITEKRWESRGFTSSWDRRRFVASTLAALRPRLPKSIDKGPRAFVLASPNNLTCPKLIKRILKYERAKFVCLVHDLIPLQFPEYSRADGVAKHERRVATVMELGDGIVTNSHATMQALAPWLERSPRKPELAVAHLGTRIPFATDRSGTPDARPYFVCVGTIEPRKNHLLLLNIWRHMATQRGPENIPKLLVIGRRGWENEQVVDMLERCPFLKGCVEEHNQLADDGVMHLVAGARALLLPSFAEGYGMPVSEALAASVPVICSDLPALREAGGDIPDFLDPLDGPTWLNAIADYAQPDSVARNNQLTRLASWQPPTWEAHISTVLAMADKVTNG